MNIIVSSVHVAPRSERPSGHEHSKWRLDNSSSCGHTWWRRGRISPEARFTLQSQAGWRPHVHMAGRKVGIEINTLSVHTFPEMPARVTVQNIRAMVLVAPAIWLTHGDGGIRGKTASKEYVAHIMIQRLVKNASKRMFRRTYEQRRGLRD